MLGAKIAHHPQPGGIDELEQARRRGGAGLHRGGEGGFLVGDGHQQGGVRIRLARGAHHGLHQFAFDPHGAELHHGGLGAGGQADHRPAGFGFLLGQASRPGDGGLVEVAIVIIEDGCGRGLARGDGQGRPAQGGAGGRWRVCRCNHLRAMRILRQDGPARQQGDHCRRRRHAPEATAKLLISEGFHSMW